MIEHYENKITELEMLVRKLDLHNKVLKKDLDDKHREEKVQKTSLQENTLSIQRFPCRSRDNIDSV